MAIEPKRGRIAPPTVIPVAVFFFVLQLVGTPASFATLEAGADDLRISQTGPDGDPTFDAVESAVAYNHDDRQVLVAWVADVDGPLAGEREVFVQRVDAVSGRALGAATRISDSGPDGDALFAAEDVAAAYNSTAGEYLIVWEADDTVDGENEIFGQRLNAAGVEVGSNDFRISDMGPDGDLFFDARSPEVAWASGSNVYLVVWSGDDDTGALVEGENEIFAQLLDASGGEFGANDFRISDMGPDGTSAYDASSPDVAYGESTDEFLVVWDSDDNTAPLVDRENEIFAQRVSSAGVEVGSNDFRVSDMGPDGNISFDAESPAVAYNPSSERYLVVWLGDDDTAPLVEGEDEIFGQLLSTAGVEVGTNDFRISDLGTDGSDLFDALQPAVAVDPASDEFLVAWEGDDNAGLQVEGEHEVFVQRLDSGGLEVGANDLRVSELGPNGSALYDAGKPALAFTVDEFMVVFQGDDNEGGMVVGESEIFQQRIVTQKPALRLSGVCPGAVTLETEGGTPGASIAILGSVASGPFIVPAGGCLGTPIDLQAPRLFSIVPLDGDGGFSLDLSLGAGVCGLLLQAFDLGACQASNVAVLP